jgi:hypothetical protein
MDHLTCTPCPKVAQHISLRGQGQDDWTAGAIHRGEVSRASVSVIGPAGTCAYSSSSVTILTTLSSHPSDVTLI